METTEQITPTYCITGTDRSGKRFKMQSTNFHYLNSINIWKGTLWKVLCNGKRMQLRTFNN